MGIYDVNEDKKTESSYTVVFVCMVVYLAHVGLS